MACPTLMLPWVFFHHSWNLRWLRERHQGYWKSRVIWGEEYFKVETLVYSPFLFEHQRAIHLHWTASLPCFRTEILGTIEFFFFFLMWEQMLNWIFVHLTILLRPLIMLQRRLLSHLLDVQALGSGAGRPSDGCWAGLGLPLWASTCHSHPHSILV